MDRLFDTEIEKEEKKERKVKQSRKERRLKTQKQLEHMLKRGRKFSEFMIFWQAITADYTDKFEVISIYQNSVIYDIYKTLYEHEIPKKVYNKIKEGKYELYLPITNFDFRDILTKYEFGLLIKLIICTLCIFHEDIRITIYQTPHLVPFLYKGDKKLTTLYSIIISWDTITRRLLEYGEVVHRRKHK